ncbi:TraB domain-containing protein [Auxenochlorella protothecoides]|uniref:TraB domain-containing protein n=1 Tax=Auxenochlorella protothecoides TaxID=3075 RepID=A0A087SGC7_AUXPR|nr:TraB domain-containing protein [Auxenochlorella protothecoides]KFM24781.1 TraB domain-containing protein [Auxenochlorella protothecoides]
MQSCRDAADLIARVRPDFVLLELCNERISILSLDKFEEPNFGAAVAAIRSGKSTPFQALYSWLLAKVATNLEIKPGEEFRVALRSAQQVGAKVVLGDRLVSVTLARVWGGLSIWEKLSLVKNLTWTGFSMLDAEALTKEIESMKEADVLTEAILEFGKEYPGMIGPLLTERNLYMVYMMRKLAAHASSVVAVVGAGHLQGIRENWESAIDIEALMELPPDRPLRRRLIKLGALAGSVLAVTLVVRFVLKRRA